ncbi:hypothetical protein RBU60_01890 [Mesonia sp. MT50]|uniref:Uncharacterized protein n=1 Tax=Mesonia profundi TaxID=3070998 RepID=A0ABU0ZZ87_9FLAO|nr:hypothetical protein [Mesonia profundi]MDQ7916311.1 hypothetical protein [Mesonia profundi]
MKQKILTYGLLVFVLLAFSACSSDDDANNEIDATVDNLFNVQDAILQNRDFPTASSEASLEILNMNTNVIPGGTSYATIQTSTPAERIYIGAVDELGYFELTPESSSDLDQSFILKISQLNEEENFSVRLAYLDQNNQVSQAVIANLMVTSVGTGTLQVSLSFDNDKDVDLHLIEPDGEHIYYGSMNSSNGGELDLDSNPACSIDGINNENITYPEEAQLDAGTYYVYVDMYSNCDPSIATNYVASVYLNGVEIPTSTQNPFNATFPVDFPSNGGGSGIENDINPVFSFEVPEGSSSRPAQVETNFQPKPMTESAKRKLEFSQNR